MLEQGVNEFVQACFKNCSPAARKSKFVHDPIWGTIEVKGYEVALLDTPLLQRLRFIHQTGFVFQTYPCARHSRYEHTLGVMHVAGKMAEVLLRKNSEQVTTKTVQRVRLAAILHDTGHSAFSHTSEEFYGRCADIVDFVARNERFSSSGAGEILSYLIGTSPAFREFFAKIKANHPELEAEVDEFALLVTGKPTDSEKIFEAEILSGPFDADKLDYFPRDGRSAGIQLALDTDRLLHCLEIARTKKADGKESWALVVNEGGFNPLQQLLFARATLFATVYHHQKVRACDSMVKGCFESLLQTGRGIQRYPNQVLSLKSAADFLHVNDQVFLAQEQVLDPDCFAAKEIANLLGRKLSKRVLTIATRTLANPEDDETKIGYLRFTNLASYSSKTRDLAKQICEKAKVCEVHSVWVDVPHKANLDKAGRALMRTDGGQYKALSEIVPVAEWIKTFSSYYTKSYIFGPAAEDARVKLCIAAREILKNEFKFTLKSTAIPTDIRAKVLAEEGKEKNA